MKKKTACLLSMLLCVGSLAGCAKTPESSLVKQKGTASLGNYEEGSSLEEKAQEKQDAAEDAQGESGSGIENGSGTENGSGSEGEATEENLLRTALGAPETYESTVTDTTGKLTVNTNAVVEIPNADKVSAINVSQHPFDQEQIDLITDAFFQGGKIYDEFEMTRMTKADCMEKIQELKGYVAEGNLDPYDSGKDENGNYVYDIYGAIEAWEQNYEEAPEEAQFVEVKPSLDQQPQENNGPDDFYGYVVMPDGAEYSYSLTQYASMPMEVRIAKVHIDERTGEKDMQGARPWCEYSMREGSSIKNYPTKEELVEKVGITLEEAQAAAEEKVAALGFTDMQLRDWDYGIFVVDYASIKDDIADTQVEDYGYILHYTRTINGIPITYTRALGGALESMESDMETWGYETLDIVVTRNGIDAVDLYNRYDIREVKTENLNLLPFDEIMQIYEKMMQIQHANVDVYAESLKIEIDRITFGYTRIYEPASSSQTGVLVPAWDFFGATTTEYKLEDGTTDFYYGDDKVQSRMTINAIDGSIIDRELGY